MTQEKMDAVEKPVGKIEYISGRGSSHVEKFYTPESYIKAYEEALDSYGVVGGFKGTTITRDPATRKAIDDLICGAFGEENPYDLEHYQQEHAGQQPEGMELEADEALEP